MNPLKNILGGIARIINIFVQILLLLSAFSGYVSPDWSMLFPYLGLFFPFIFIGNLLVFFIWLTSKQWKLCVLNMIIILICIPSIHTYFPIHTKTKNIPEGCIKILTYNVMYFEWVKPHTPNKSNKILQYIKENDADIVCIQEFGASKNNKEHLTEKEIMKAMKKYPYHYIHHLKYPYSSSEIFGLAVFSKFPILSTRKIPYQSKYNGSFEVELDIHGKRVTLINNHLESNKLSKEERDEYYRLTQDIDSQSLDAFTQMMTKRLSPAYRIRAQQAECISQVVKENKNPYTIVCGDFNDTPISYARYKIKGDLQDAFVNSGCGLGITYNRYRFLFRIDYILHSNNIKSYNCTVGKLKNSDHYPLWCYLQLN